MPASESGYDVIMKPHERILFFIVMTGIWGANVMNGVDPECRNWIAKFREPAAEGEGGRERRSNRRRRG